MTDVAARTLPRLRSASPLRTELRQAADEYFQSTGLSRAGGAGMVGKSVVFFAWAIAFFDPGWEGYAAIMVFIAILGIALVYEWRSGALDWGKKTRLGLKETP